jgi:pimeloyl-ACP methyl ester carboxylesterase
MIHPEQQDFVEDFEMTSDQADLPEVRLHTQLLGLWSRFLGTDKISIDDNFFEKGGDSLLATELLLELAKLTGQALPVTALFEDGTVREIAKRLSQPTRFPPKAVIQMGSADTQPSLLFFHGDYNQWGNFDSNLVDRLKSKLPLTLIAAHGVGDEKIPPSIEEMAADRLSLVLAAQSQGPFRLGGHCSGALVAFETARLLIAAGHKVEFVAMIDAATITARKPIQLLISILIWILRSGGVRPNLEEAVLASTWQKLVAYERFSMLSWAQWWAKTRDWIRGISVDRPPRRGSASQAAQTENLELRKVIDRHRKYARAMAVYFPAPLAVPIVYFSSEYNGRPWERISSDLELIVEPGGHYEWVTIRAGRLARHLHSRMQGVRANSHVTDIRELPPLPQAPSEPRQWHLIEGLNAEVIEGSPMVTGQHIMRLAAAGPEGRHALGARFGGFSHGGTCRAIAWFKTEPGVRVMIEARDTHDPLTGKPSNYGVASFNLADRSIVNRTGDILNSGMEAAQDGWQKIWVELRSSDGQVFVLMGLLEGGNNRHVFKERGQEVTFGGFEIIPSTSVNELGRVDKFAPIAHDGEV